MYNYLRRLIQEIRLPQKVSWGWAKERAVNQFLFRAPLRSMWTKDAIMH
jgi:hypothetical protein